MIRGISLYIFFIKMRVLSLFDWMACGYEALQRAWIPIDVYYASEIDKYAIQIAKKNHPDIIEIWDVTQIKWEDYKDIDIIIGGSPCQWFSMAWKMLNFDDPRSKLFFEFVRLVKEIQPKYFLLENVKMKKEFQDVISGYMWVEPIEIDSALVSAQRRKRLYWTNIPWITQPKDKWIMLKDILESNAPDKYNLTERGMKMLMRNFGSKWQALNFDPSVLFKITYPSVCEQQEWLDRKCPTLTASMWTGGGNVPCIIQKVWDRDKNNWGVRTDKSYTLPANPMSDRWQLVVEIPKEWEKLIDVVDWEVRVKQATKQWYIVAEEWDWISLSYPSSTTRRWRVVKWKSNTLTACGQDSWVYEPMVAYAPWSREFEQQWFKTWKAPTLCARDYKDPKIVAIPCATQLWQSENFWTAYGSEKAYTLRASNPNWVIESIQPPRIRKLTPIECERLQTMPDNYTEWVSDTQRYKMLWNWWTCDVISHIFSFLPKE